MPPRMDPIIETGFGLEELGACAVKLAHCPICMKELNEALYWLGLETDFLKRDVKMIFVFIHEACQLPPSEQQVVDNIVNLIYEFPFTILV